MCVCVCAVCVWLVGWGRGLREGGGGGGVERGGGGCGQKTAITIFDDTDFPQK